MIRIPKGHFRCPACDAVVRLDRHGFAACERCGLIYNEMISAPERMSNRSRKRILEKVIYDVNHNTG